MKRMLILLLLVFAGILAIGAFRQPQSFKLSNNYDPTKDPLVNPPHLFEQLKAGQEQLADENQTIMRNLGGNPNSLNPIFGSSAAEMSVTGMMFSDLFTFDAAMNWSINPDVVESLDESPDHLVNRVKIKPGLKWHDGQPWTAHDVQFSYEAIMNEKVPCPAVKTGTDELAGVKALDDLTVEFTHKKALPTNKWNMFFPIIPKHIFDNPAERKADPTLMTSDYFNRYNRTEIIGSGPYKFVRWITNDRIILERWEDFPGRKPYFKQQIYKIITDPNVSLLSFRKGTVDETGLNTLQFVTQTNTEEFKRVGVKAFGTQWSFQYIAWNMDGSNPFFNDVKVRQAMAHAFNMDYIIAAVHKNLVTPSHGIFHPDSWMYNPEVKRITFDLEKAGTLLEESGWQINRENGLRYKTINGYPRLFEFTLLVPQGGASSERVAAIYAQDLKKIGVMMKTRTVEWATMLEMVHKHEFEAEIAGWGTGTDPDSGWNLWRTEEYKTGRNYGGYSNKEVDRLFELGRAEFDQKKRAEYYQRIQQLIYDDQPYLFLWNTSTMMAFNKRLQGVQFSPRGVAGFYPGDLAWYFPRAEKAM